MSKCIILLIFIDLSYSEYEGTEMLAVFTYANELGLEPGLNSPEIAVQWFDLKQFMDANKIRDLFTMNSKLRIRFHELKVKW